MRDLPRGEPERDDAGLLLQVCLLYTSDAADERSSVDLGGRRIIKKKNTVTLNKDVRTNNQHHKMT